VIGNQVKIYLDNCCLNRPFDDQVQARIRIEAEAKLDIQGRVLAGDLDLVWSYMVDFENAANPFEVRQKAIARWKGHAKCDIGESDEILDKAKDLERSGFRSKDALHLACAIAAKCDYFLTTDDQLLRKTGEVSDVAVINPTELLSRLDT
jgi:hypothetical protein